MLHRLLIHVKKFLQVTVRLGQQSPDDALVVDAVMALVTECHKVVRLLAPDVLIGEMMNLKRPGGSAHGTVASRHLDGQTPSGPPLS